ncbi:MAG: transketolase family protein [Nanoarchaeota archaeon]
MLAEDFSSKQYPRDGFGHALLELAEKNPRVVALTAGVSESVRTHWFAEKFPDRFFQMGIAEQNMIGAAVGLSLTGFIPYASSFGSFMPSRSFDQIRVSMCYNKVKVNLVSTHCGLNTGEDGASAQMMEDFSMMRALPNMTVIAPCDYLETKKAVIAAANYPESVYIRVGREKTPVITTESTPFKIGKAEIFREGKDVTIMACGLMVFEAIKAAKELEKQNISAEIINLHTIKPIDSEAIIKSAKKTGAVVTAEEHQIYGGMGSAIAEVLSQNYPVPMKMVAMNDVFGVSGRMDELFKAYNLDSSAIVRQALAIMKLKK